MTVTLGVTSHLVLMIVRINAFGVICDFLMTYLKEQDICIEFRLKLEKTLLEMHEMLKTVGKTNFELHPCPRCG
jgi:hypothetical protein